MLDYIEKNMETADTEIDPKWAKRLFSFFLVCLTLINNTVPLSLETILLHDGKAFFPHIFHIFLNIFAFICMDVHECTFV